MTQFVQQYSVKCWSVRCVEMHWYLCCQPTSGPLVIPHSDVDVHGTSNCWSSSKHLGHYVTELLQVSTIGQLEGRGEGCEPVGKSDATVRILLHRIMNKTI